MTLINKLSDKLLATKLLFRILCILVPSLLIGCSAKPEQWLNKESMSLPTAYQGEVFLIPEAPQALAYRIQAVRNAERYIEVEYFSWNADASGMTLWNELLAAAKRGVKVSVIVDDLLIFDEKWLVDIDRHPNLSIKLFNPFNARKMGWLTRAADFEMHRERLNHRLHEKYFNVDGQLMVLGGRNIGDDYFGFSPDANFFDLDVLVKGEVISAYEENFDQLWVSELVVPVRAVIAYSAKRHDGSFAAAYQQNIANNQMIVESIERKLELLPDPKYIEADLFPMFDSKRKRSDSQSYLRKRIEHFANINEWPQKELVLSTPYMIQSQEHDSMFSALVERDVDVTVLTNSVASNDSPFAAAYYQTYRLALLDLGIKVFEYDSHSLHSSNYFNSHGYYHNKAFIADNRISFIGSSNFDPRSDMTNLELGLLVESDEFARDLKMYLQAGNPDKFWQVGRHQDDLVWSKQNEIKLMEPRMKSNQRLTNGFYRMLKIQNEL
ncbi:phospholipase D family protein [Photobacterium sp. BZF1]|uniref:phospholipase D family protein n=1 Tax=Photobacterium sp. BZF1 TaxID=1904457 RepID=UPI0016539F63|nr:phospholipase D family protein [Photobacterium sp. BZF1]MBC7002073.1 phospholipase D family protein [Photobacterium sp. BZF1]